MKSNLNKAVHKQGLILEGEVKDSIAGRKAEPKSFDTGRFAGSIKTDNSQKYQSKIYSDVPYSQYLEYGTSRIKARNHFRNSKSRREPFIIEAIRSAL